jgi:polysaccharide export outer membrane protein/exopolysaccharide production protein ExoF
MRDASASDSGNGPADYRLGAQDKVRIRVFEWRPAKDEVFEWSALNAEYTVGPSGKLSLPLVGELSAEGASTADLANIISERLMERMGLAARPDTSVEVTQFRPFYVIGYVDKPGEYPYRPSLSVLQAMTIAGGLKRMADHGVRLQREIFTTRGEISLYAKEFTSLLARRARLDAELKDLDLIEYPRALLAQGDDPEIRLLIDQEGLIFARRQEAFATQTLALRQKREQLESEAASLDRQLGAHDKLSRLVTKELETVQELFAKGLTIQPRKLALERNVAQLEGDRLKLDASVIKARHEISRTDMAIQELENKRSSEIANDLQLAQQRLEQISLKSETARTLLYESQVLAPVALAGYIRASAAEPIYKVIRRVRGQTQEFAATETTILEPGDTVKVEPQGVADRAAPLPVRWDALPPEANITRGAGASLARTHY